MAAVDPLANLADIQEPMINGHWFERPLLWLLLVLLVAILSWLAVRQLQRYRQQAPRREALQLLQQLPAPCTASELTEILKRYLKARQVPASVLSATPTELQRFLESNAAGIAWPDLMALHYQRDVDAALLLNYRQSLQQWLTQHPWVLTLP